MARFRMFALVPVLILAAACSSKAGTAASSTPVELDVADIDNAVEPPPSVNQVPKGKEVAITVYSTVTDVVHVHGYEKRGSVGAGSEVVVSFVATKSGTFDVDMEHTHVKLLQVRVS